jgi:hypothetical protein
MWKVFPSEKERKKSEQKVSNASSLHPFRKSIKKYHFGKKLEIPFGKSI